MAVKCPNCGAENPDSAKFCQMCARQLSQYYQNQISAPVAPNLPKPKTHSNQLIITVVAVVVVVIVALAVYVIALKPDLRAELSYYAANDWLGLASSGTVSVDGQIYNYGYFEGGGTVYLHVYDGYTWHDYYVPTGVVPGGGSVYFDWGTSYTMMDEDLVQVEYSLIGDEKEGV